jgi:hypothetical protein
MKQQEGLSCRELGIESVAIPLVVSTWLPGKYVSGQARAVVKLKHLLRPSGPVATPPNDSKAWFWGIRR